jgi:hypothetical protein
MGFLDKLLGRSKEAADTAGDKAMEYGDKAVDMAKEGGEKAEDLYGDAKSRVTGEGDDAASQVDQAEAGLDEARDQTAKDEGRIP